MSARMPLAVAVAALVAGACTAGPLARSAGNTAATGSTAAGRVTMSWTFASAHSGAVARDAGRLEYEVSGAVMGEPGRRAWAPVSFPAGYSESKTETPLYLRARLVRATLTRTFEAPCADGGAADLTTSIVAIVDRRSVFTHNGTLEFDVLRHRGTASVMPYFRVKRVGAGIVVNSAVARGLGVVRTETTGNRCPETRILLPPTVDAAMLLPRWAQIMWSSTNFSHELKARIRPDGSALLKGTSTDRYDDRGDVTTMRADVSLTLRGPLRGLGAMCTWPTNADLASATSPEQALAIVRRAGMSTRFAGTSPGPGARPGHYWIKSESRQWWCGIPYVPGALYRAA